MDASYFAPIFSSALAITRKWSAEQTRCEGVFSAILEFHGRLRLLAPESAEDEAVVGVLAKLPNAVPLLRAKHVRGLERLMSALRESVARYEALHAELSELHAATWQRHAAVTAESPAEALDEPAWGVVGAGRGADAQRVLMPPPLQCMDWLRELDAMYAAELLAKLQLVDAIDFGHGAAQLQDVAQQWLLQPHLEEAPIERLSVLVESLTLEPRPG